MCALVEFVLTALHFARFAQRKGIKEKNVTLSRVDETALSSVAGAGGPPRRTLVARWPRSIGASGLETRYCRNVAPPHYSVSAPPPEYWGRRIGTILRTVTSNAAKAADRLRRFFPFSAHFSCLKSRGKRAFYPVFGTPLFARLFWAVFATFRGKNLYSRTIFRTISQLSKIGFRCAETFLACPRSFGDAPADSYPGKIFFFRGFCNFSGVKSPENIHPGGYFQFTRDYTPQRIPKRA